VNALFNVPLWPFDVTVTLTDPAEPAGALAVMEVLLTTTTFVAALLPNVTAAGEEKLVPVIVTAVPPASGPTFGDTLLTVGATAYVKPLLRVPLWLFDVTVIFTGPAAPAGVIAVMDVLLTTVTFVAAAEPNFTVAGDAKFAPVRVTVVPPVVEPTLGETLMTIGAAAYVKALLSVPV